MTGDDDQDEPTLREQYARERQELERDIAERDSRIKRDEMLEWGKRRAEARQTPPEVVKSATRTAAMTTTLTKEWQDYIEQRIKRAMRTSDEVMATALGQTLCKDIVATEKTCAALRQDVDRLTLELAELRGEMKTRAALAEVTERLERLEAMPVRSSPFKAVG